MAVKPDYDYFKQEILEMTGIDLNRYKEKQMKRRINTLIERNGAAGYDSFIHLLQTDPAKLDYFLDYITINVTDFFRTPLHWQFLEEEVLSEMQKKDGNPARIWSTACATGEEPYSLAMSLSRYMPPSDIHILATDLDQKVLEKARTGVFSEQQVKSVPDEWKEKYFQRVSSGYQISEELQKCVKFDSLDLLKDPYPEACDLIVCRNVLIYFTEEAKLQIFQKFWNSLKDGGYLFMGDTEQIINYRPMHFQKIRPYLYQKDVSMNEKSYRF